MSENLKVEGLGENNVPAVKGLSEEKKVDVTSVPTPTPSPVEQKIDVTATPTVRPVVEQPKFDPTSQPVVTAKSNATFDPTAMPVSTGVGNAPSKDYSLYIKIGVGVFALIALIIILVSAFGGKKLVCTETEEFLGAKTETKTIVKFDGDDKVKSVRLEIKQDYTDSSLYSSKNDEYLDKMLEEQTKNLKAENLKYRREGKVFYITYDYNDEYLKYYSSTSYDSMKSMLESSGATCSNK